MGSDAPVNVRLPADLLAFVDQAAAVRFEGNRSLAVRALLRECQARSQPTTDDSSAPVVASFRPATGGCQHEMRGLRCTHCGATAAQIKAFLSPRRL